MGDSNRVKEFSRFIFYNYPKDKFPVICCIADGKLELSAELKKLGYSVIAYEPHIRGKISKSFKKSVIIKRKWFNRNENLSCDLIVGMHPDEATIEIALWGVINKTPYAIVPCCIVGDGEYTHKAKDYHSWVNLLKQLHKNTEEFVLNIGGKNRCIFVKEV